MNTHVEFIMPITKTNDDALKVCNCVLTGVGQLCGASALQMQTYKGTFDGRAAIKVDARLIDVNEATPHLDELLALDNINLGQFCALYNLGKEAMDENAVINLADMDIDQFIKEMS